MNDVSLILRTECGQRFPGVGDDILTLLNECVNHPVFDDGDAITGGVSHEENVDSSVHLVCDFARMMEDIRTFFAPIDREKDILVHTRYGVPRRIVSMVIH